MQHKYFPNRIKLFSYLNEVVEGLDVNRTIRLPNLWFCKVDGEDQKCHGTTEFCNKFNEVFDTKLDAKKSYSAGKRTVLFFDEAVQEKTIKEEVVREVIEKEEEDIKEVIIEESSGRTQPDWEWINSLTNTKEDKLSFDKYASEKFSITLNRAKKIENMVIGFKEALLLPTD